MGQNSKNVKNKINILLVSVRSDMGGGPRHICDLIEGIQKQYPNFNIYIAAPDEPPFFEQFKKYAIDVIPIPKRKLSIKAILSLIRFIRTNHINIIHSHGRGAGIYSKILYIFTRAKVVHTFHGISKDKKLIVEKILSSLTHQYICVSNSEYVKAQKLKVATIRKITVNPNGINLSLFNQSKTRNKTLQKVGIIGRLDRVKRIDKLLVAIHKKHDDLKDFTFYIAGDGPLKNSLITLAHKYQIENKVIFLGETNDICCFLNSIAVLTSFSESEGLPLSVLEAMACNTPCLLSDIDAHKNLAANNCAILFNPDLPDDFLIKLKSLQDKKASGKLIDAAYQKVCNEHNIDKMIENTIKIYESCL